MITLVDPVYNPEFRDEITSATSLAPGVTISKFLGSYGDRTSFDHETFDFKRRQIARNLYMQAEAMRVINGNTTHFNDVRLIVSEGIFDRLSSPTVHLLNDTMEKKSDGRLVYYQVIGQDGKIDFEKTFDVAEYWKDYLNYETLYLDYDSYNPDGSLTGQIGLEFPTMPATFDVQFKRDVKTFYNNHLQSNGELVEILEKD